MNRSRLITSPRYLLCCIPLSLGLICIHGRVIYDLLTRVPLKLPVLPPPFVRPIITVGLLILHICVSRICLRLVPCCVVGRRHRVWWERNRCVHAGAIEPRDHTAHRSRIGIGQSGWPSLELSTWGHQRVLRRMAAGQRLSSVRHGPCWWCKLTPSHVHVTLGYWLRVHRGPARWGVVH